MVQGYLWFMVYFNLNANLNLDCKVTQKAQKMQKIWYNLWIMTIIYA